MRRLVLAATVAALAMMATGAHAETATIKKTHTMGWVGGAWNDTGVCVGTCDRGLEVRPGEKYLHVILDASWTTSGDEAAAIEVDTVDGPVLVCGNTMSGPLDITGLTAVHYRVFFRHSACSASSVTLQGRMVMYFSDQPVSLGEAYQNATLDNPTRDMGYPPPGY